MPCAIIEVNGVVFFSILLTTRMWLLRTSRDRSCPMLTFSLTKRFSEVLLIILGSLRSATSIKPCLRCLGPLAACALRASESLMFLAS